MAVPAGRSVVFVTGNAKKLEEVRIKRLISENRQLAVVLSCSNRFRPDLSE